MNHKRVFLDYASATPIDKKVFKKMKGFFSKKNFANPSALYKEAQEIKKEIEKSRSSIAKICGVKKHEVIFTSGGTESINLAISGVANAYKEKYTEIITTKIEHPATVETLKNLEKTLKVIFLEVNSKGNIDIDNFIKTLSPETLLVSILYVNNEIGNVNPIKKISSEIKKFKNKIGRNFNEPPFIHLDACQAPNYFEINFDKLGVDLMTLDGSKIFGPKGVGCLIKKDHIKIKSIILGGNQEFGIRAGTENTMGIIGMAYALELANKNREKNFKKVSELQDYFLSKLKSEIFSKIEGAKINGSLENRSPANVNFCIPNLNAEFAVIRLDQKGVACSSVTACKSINSDSRSYVIDALDSQCGSSSLRFSLSHLNTKKDIDFTIAVLKRILL